MTARIAEVAKDTYQVNTHFADMDFSLNQYLVVGEEPLLFHTCFGHVEADECGVMNKWLDAARLRPPWRGPLRPDG